MNGVFRAYLILKGRTDISIRLYNNNKVAEITSTKCSNKYILDSRNGKMYMYIKNKSNKREIGTQRGGYKTIRLLDNTTLIYTHILVYVVFNWPKVEKLYEEELLNGFNTEYDVHHKDFYRYNNSLDNLILLSRSQHRKLHIEREKELAEKKKREANKIEVIIKLTNN